MSVDPQKPRKILCVHGVQMGNDADQQQHKEISDLIDSRLGNIPLTFETEMYRYENINDAAQKRYKQLLKLVAQTPAGGIVADKAFDLVADVVTAMLDTSTAAKIRAGLRARILEIFDEGNPCYLVAHSLGTIYAFDVINALMREEGLFLRDSRRTWPLQGLVTLGSPIGLPMFSGSERKKVTKLGPGTKWFRWLNYWDRTDPVVSGNIFGKQVRSFGIAEKYQLADPHQGWVIRDRAVDTGRLWLLAHTAYWSHPIVGDGIVDMITN
jgi:hypothetical protein